MNDVLSLISEIIIEQSNGSMILPILDKETTIDLSLDALVSIEILKNIESTIP